MIEIQKWTLASPTQWEMVNSGIRNSYGSHDRSDSFLSADGNFIIGPADVKLFKALFKKSSDERKFLRMLPIIVDIRAPLYFWKEFDTYKVGTCANSESTMHRLMAQPFDILQFSTEHLCFEESRLLLDNMIIYLNKLRNAYLCCNDLEEKRKYWWQIIQLLPSSYMQKRTVSLNYEVVLRMYQARKEHKLDEWRDFCDWIEKEIMYPLENM